MAAGRIISQLLRKRHHFQACAPILVPSFAFNGYAYQGNVESAGMKSLRALAVMGVGVYGVISFATVASADEAEHGIACPTYPWPHKGILDSYDHDHASIRRGQQVYQQSCASCHSFSLFSYRNLVGVAYAEAEIKAVTAYIEVVDGPNDEGEAFERAARTYNSDSSIIKRARHNGQSYIFSLLLAGSRHPTAGVMIGECLHYNPCFSAVTTSPRVLTVADDPVNATHSPDSLEKGKDVVTFLSWAT